MMHLYPYWTDILANPQDNEPRLQLAAWLDERDDPRGEFIRLQCQLETLPVAAPLRFELEARERELLMDHEEQWLGEISPLVDWCVFKRGFPEEIATSTSTYLRHADEVFAKTTICQLHLSSARDKIAQLTQCHAVRRLTYLDLSNNHLRDAGVKILADSVNLGNLEGLNLSTTGIGDAGARALAASQHLVGLRELYLCDNFIGKRGLQALADSPLVRQLENLSIRFNHCSADGPRLLHADPALSLHH